VCSSDLQFRAAHALLVPRALHHAVGEPRVQRYRLLGAGAPEQRAAGLDLGDRLGERRVRLHARRERGAFLGLHLAVDEPRRGDAIVLVDSAHLGLPPRTRGTEYWGTSSGWRRSSASLKRCRARNSRDSTVPMLHCSTAAMSVYERSSYSRRIRIVRYFSGSVSSTSRVTRRT